MHQKRNILIKNADFIVTMNENRDVFQNASLLISDNKIIECPSNIETADEIIDATGKIIFPGFINTHHHFFQTSFRFVDEMQNSPLDKWVAILGKYAVLMDESDWYNSAMTSMAELALSGCTTTTDHCYLIPNNRNNFFDEEVKAASDLGMRFHPVRGSMTLSKEQGTIFPKEICQDLPTVLSEIERVIKKYHDNSFGSMCKVAAGPCFPVYPVSSSEEEMKAVMKLCRKYNIRMHTHSAEEIDEYDFTVKKYGKTPIEYLESIDCLGEDVWLAHGIFLNKNDIKTIKRTKTSIASCPSANSRGAGISKVTEYLNEGIVVGVGVDGAAGNDTSNILSELRMLRTLQGAREGVLQSYLINHNENTKNLFSKDIINISYLKIEKLLEIATLNGASCLGREKEIGSLENGKLADLVIFDDGDISHAGSFNRVGSIFSCAPLRAWYTIINGKVIVKEGELVSLDEKQVVDRQNKTTKKLKSCM